MSISSPLKTLVGLCVALLIATSERALAQGGCLPELAGDTISLLVNQGAIEKVTPSGWTLESANIDMSRLILTFKDEQGMRLGVTLIEPGSTNLEATGRWFAMETFGNFGTMPFATRKHLKEIVSVIDSAFTSSPWVSCAEGLLPPGPVSKTPTSILVPYSRSNTPRKHLGRANGKSYDQYWFIPSWAYITLGLFSMMVLLVGLVLTFWNALPTQGHSRSPGIHLDHFHGPDDKTRM